jgi:hypothetical protein
MELCPIARGTNFLPGLSVPPTLGPFFHSSFEMEGPPGSDARRPGKRVGGGKRLKGNAGTITINCRSDFCQSIEPQKCCDAFNHHRNLFPRRLHRWRCHFHGTST